MNDKLLTGLRDAAIEIAWAGGRSTLAWFNNGVAVDTKRDGTPVTVADRDAEQLMRRLIRARFPTHAVLGEEHGVDGPDDAAIRWILDPIDGTKAFVRGVPLYGTLVGVEVEGEPAVGVIYMPALDEMVAAARGLGCRWNGRPCRVNDTSDLADAWIATTDGNVLRQRLGAEGHDRLCAATQLERTWADCYAYVLIATGRCDISLDPVLAVWDCGPLLTIVEEAGGRFTDWEGVPTIHGGEAVATNGHLHDAILAFTRGRPKLPV